MIHPPRTRDLIRRLAPTLFTVAVVGYFVGMPYFGFAHWLLVPIVAVWAVHSAWRAWRRPAERRYRVAQMLVGSLALCCTLGLHAWRATASRQAADEFVAAVEAYRAAHGTWPAQQDEVGSDSLRRSFHRWRGAYHVRDGAPDLFYFSTWEPFSAHHYDFAARRWRYFAG